MNKQCSFILSIIMFLFSLFVIWFAINKVGIVFMNYIVCFMSGMVLTIVFWAYHAIKFEYIEVEYRK